MCFNFSSKVPLNNNGGMSSLESLKKLTTIVADTGDFESMKRFKPQVSAIESLHLIHENNVPWCFRMPPPTPP